MLLRHITLAVLLTVSPFGAAARLGPETPITPSVGIEPASFLQAGPAIASNGENFLAVWRDHRENSGVARMFTSRFDATGQAIDPLGNRFHEIGFRESPLIASDGADYLIVWRRGDSLFAQRVDENGVPIAAERVIDTGQSPTALASDGSTYVVRTAVALILLDRDGTVLDRIPLPSSILGPGMSDGAYHFVGHQDGKTFLRTLDTRFGTLGYADTFVPDAPADVEATIGVLPDRILYLWKGLSGPQFMVLDSAGATVKPATFVNLPGTGFLTVVTDGTEFLLVENSQRAIRVSAEGDVLDPSPIMLSVGQQFQFASNGERSVWIWMERNAPSLLIEAGDIVSVAFRQFNDHPLSTSAKTIVALSGRAQDNVRIAESGSHRMAVWRDSRGSEIRGAIDGVELTIAAGGGTPSVAAGTNSFLVAWYELVPDARLLARRYAFDGTAFDGALIVVSSPVAATIFDDDPGIAADGSSFVISVPAGNELRLVRVDESSGTVSVDVVYDCNSDCRGSYRPIRTPSEWIVPFVRFPNPIFFSTWRPSFARIPLSGNGGSETDTALTCDDEKHCLRLAVANAGERVSVLIPRPNAIQVAQSTGGGTINLPNTAGAAGLAAAWNGSEYVVVWTTFGGGPVRAMRFDANWRALDAVPFELASAGATLGNPSIAVTDHGVVIAYSRSTPESAWAPRAFTRTLDPLQPRRRAVRH